MAKKKQEDDKKWDGMGKSFGVQRRKDAALAEQALARVEAEDREAAAEFRSSIMAHLRLIGNGCSSPASFFTDEFITQILGDIKTKVSKKDAFALVREFVDKALGGMAGMLLCNDPGRSGDWYNLGLFADDLSSVIYARVFDIKSGSIAVRTVAIAYFNDEMMVPAIGSEWFWDLEMSVGLRMPIPMPFRRPEVDPANDPAVVDDIAERFMHEAIKDITEAADAAQESDDYASIEKLRLQIAISAQRALPLNRLLTGEGIIDAKGSKSGWSSDIEAAFKSDHVTTARSIVEWARAWMEEQESVKAFRRSVIRFSDKRVKIPAVMPGTVEAYILTAVDEKEISRGLLRYIQDIRKQQLVTQEAVDTVLRVRPDLRESVEGKSPDDAIKALQAAV